MILTFIQRSGATFLGPTCGHFTVQYTVQKLRGLRAQAPVCQN